MGAGFPLSANDLLTNGRRPPVGLLLPHELVHGVGRSLLERRQDVAVGPKRYANVAVAETLLRDARV